MYSLRLQVEKDKSRLALYQNGVERAAREWEESRDMGRRVFESIEEVMKEASIVPENIASFQVISELPDSSTSRRIAETVARVYTFGVETPGSD